MCIPEDMRSQKKTKCHVETHRLHVVVVLRCQLPPTSGKHRDIPVTSPHRNLTRILSHNHDLRTCTLWRHGQSKTDKCHLYTHRLIVSVVLCSQLPPNSGNHRHIPDTSPHRYLTHVVSHNHGHRMCISAGMDSQKPLHCTTFRFSCALHCCQTPSNTEVSQNGVHTGTPHTFCVTPTTIACVFVMK